jgi:hypothetical protein
MVARNSRRVVNCLPPLPHRYRYRLQVALGTGPSLTLILKNPSLADAVRSDPTAGKVEAWAARHGFGLVTYVNLFAFRSPYPTALNQVSYCESVGPENDLAIGEAIAGADVVVAAWGNPNGIAVERYRQRIDEVLTLVQTQWFCSLHTIGGFTKLGYPRHGLHWNGAVGLEEWITSA